MCSASHWRCLQPGLPRPRRLSDDLHSADPGPRDRHRRDLEAHVQFRLRHHQPGLGSLGLMPRDWLGAPERASLRDRRRHLALDAVLLPPAARRPRIPAAGRFRGRADRRRELVAGARLRHPAADDADDRRHARLPGIVAFKVFDEVFLLTGGGPGTATEVLSFTIYQRFFTEDRVGYGSAMSSPYLRVALILVAALSSRRRSESGA